MVQDLARELGIAIASSEEFKKMTNARRNIQADPALRSLLNEFTEKREGLTKLMENGDEGLLEASNDLERLQGQLLENPFFTDLLDAENEFQRLLSVVNDEIAKCISAVDPTAKISTKCSGQCGCCSGCTH